jgi:hypothetical protein
MKLAQDVDLEIVRAQIHVKNGRRLLASAQNDLVISALEVIKTKHNRDRVSVVRIVILYSFILVFSYFACIDY